MSIPTPDYLKNNVIQIKTSKSETQLKVVCDCGNDRFCLYKNIVKKTDEQKSLEKQLNEFQRRLGWRSSYISKFSDGHYYAYRKNFLGGIAEKINIDLLKQSDKTEIYRCQCLTCKNNILLYDSRFFGFEAVETKQELKKRNYSFKQIKNMDDVSLFLDIANDDSLEKFNESTELNMDLIAYSNLFSWIRLIAYRNGKKTVVFEKEVR